MKAFPPLPTLFAASMPQPNSVFNGKKVHLPICICLPGCCYDTLEMLVDIKSSGPGYIASKRSFIVGFLLFEYLTHD